MPGRGSQEQGPLDGLASVDPTGALPRLVPLARRLPGVGLLERQLERAERAFLRELERIDDAPDAAAKVESAAEAAVDAGETVVTTPAQMLDALLTRSMHQTPAESLGSLIERRSTRSCPTKRASSPRSPTARPTRCCTSTREVSALAPGACSQTRRAWAGPRASRCPTACRSTSTICASSASSRRVRRTPSAGTSTTSSSPSRSCARRTNRRAAGWRRASSGGPSGSLTSAASCGRRAAPTTLEEPQSS